MSEQKDEDRGKMYIFVKDKLHSGIYEPYLCILMSNMPARYMPYDNKDSRL